LVIVNKGDDEGGQQTGFWVCNKCGKSESDPMKHKAHQRDYLVSGRTGGACTGSFEPVYLGYGFSSDVLLLRIPISSGLRFDVVNTTDRKPISDALQSLAEALVISIGRKLDIDIREINAGFRFVREADEHFADIFVYDTLSGGAGYATQAGDEISAVFAAVFHLLADCDCSASCDKCLRHYGNRFHHNVLDRHLALDLAQYIHDGVIPQQMSEKAQAEVLRPLVSMLELAGWLAERGPRGNISVSRGGKKANLYAAPSLTKPIAVGITLKQGDFAFSPYELARDLPGAFSLIQ
jgi:hypothetical protein